MGVVMEGTYKSTFLTNVNPLLEKMLASFTTSKKRPISLRVLVSPAEHEELVKAADRAGMALSVYIRAMSLEAARRAATSIRTDGRF